MRTPGRSWLVLGGCVLAVTVALAWVTVVMLGLERDELRATTAARHQEAQQSALWRMDSWLSVFLGREAARPYSDYLPFTEDQTNSPSPLLAFESDYIPLHFQLTANGVTSPQAPTSIPNRFELPLSSVELALKQQKFDSLAEYLDLERVRTAVELAESLPTTKLATLAMAPETLPAEEHIEYEARAMCSVPPAPGSAWADGIQVDVGPLIPMWISNSEDKGNDQLVFVRRVGIGEDKLFQGFFVDWPKLGETLLNQVGDLLADATLVRVLPQSSEVHPDQRYLANVPVALVAPKPDPPTPAALTPARTTLGIAWLLAMVASLAVGITLHKSVELSERRQRFVSAVTHELRTPLTTFKMYSEMLADGMVPKEEQRQQYLETLKDESGRLSAMVENVLTHARLEQSNGAQPLEPLTLDALLARVTPPLYRQAEAFGFQLDLHCDPPGDLSLKVDAESIGQVLSNLVDNAGKYGRNGNASAVNLTVQQDNGSLILKVRDHGPGVSETVAKSIFSAFDRGDRDPTDPNPGIGLGLSISRGLARDMGGDVTLESNGGEGACFRLEVPLST